MRAFYINSWLLFFSFPAIAQQFEYLTEQVPVQSEKYVNHIESKISSIKSKLQKQTAKYLKKITGNDRKILRQLQINGMHDSSLLGFPEILTALTNKTPDGLAGKYGLYIPRLDSISVTLHFLEKTGMKGVINSIEHLKGLQNSFLTAEKIKDLLKKRGEQLKQVLSGYSKLPGRLNNYFKKFSRTSYYYSAQVKEYKQLLSQPEKIEEKILSQLNKLPSFQKFLQQNSLLASLFKQEDPGRPLEGLQARSEVQANINTRISLGGRGSTEIVQACLAEAHGQVNKIVDAVTNTGHGSVDMPGMEKFKPGDLKTRSFLKRLELGTTLQSNRSNHYLPASADIGMSLGYKMNDKSIIGLGLSYKFSIHRSRFSQEGAGVKSFLDLKIKRSVYLSGGYEKHYLSHFNSPNSFSESNGWQTSGLIGLTSKYKISKKITGIIQLLWDFLSYKNVPVSQPLIYRIGYSLK
jgi:hypothetical protein